MATAFIPVKQFRDAYDSILADAAQDSDGKGGVLGRRTMVLYYHNLSEQPMTIEREQFYRSEKPNLLKVCDSYRCALIGFYQTADGFAYKVLYHEFLNKDKAAMLKKYGSVNAMIVGMSLGNRFDLMGQLVYAELVPLKTEQAKLALLARCKQKCGSPRCHEIGCRRTCKWCKQTPYCSRRCHRTHWDAEHHETCSREFQPQV